MSENTIKLNIEKGMLPKKSLGNKMCIIETRPFDNGITSSMIYDKIILWSECKNFLQELLDDLTLQYIYLSRKNAEDAESINEIIKDIKKFVAKNDDILIQCSATNNK